MKLITKLSQAARSGFSAALKQLHKTSVVKDLRQLLKDHILTLSGLSAISTAAYMHNHILGVLVAGVLTIVFNERVSV